MAVLTYCLADSEFQLAAPIFICSTVPNEDHPAEKDYPAFQWYFKTQPRKGFHFDILWYPFDILCFFTEMKLLPIVYNILNINKCLH